MSGQLQVIALTPPGFADGRLPLDASRAGFIGGTALEYAEPAAGEGALRTAAGAGVEFCASVGFVSAELADALRRARPALTRIILCEADASRLAGDVAGLRDAGFKVFVQATCLAEAQLASAPQPSAS